MTPELIGGRYRVQSAIGQGGMGTVWLCTDETLHRDVAVKQIGHLPGETAAGTARAMREARSAAAMNHRNAVSVYDVVDEAGTTWLVMEHFPSRTLGEVIREEGPLSPDRAGRVVAQVADALAAAHALGIVHRDVKPGNVLVGADDVAKISDFGIARGAQDTSLTQTGMMAGTPAYFAPELSRGADPSPASDVWALGATLYAAVQGEPPFGTTGNPFTLLARITNDPVPRPEQAGHLLPLLGEMLAKDPEQRPTMAAVTTRLHADADAAGPPTEPASPPTKVAPAPAPPPPTTTEPAPAAAAGTSGRSRTRRLLPVVLALLLVVALAGGAYALLRDDPSETASPDGQSGQSASSTPTGDSPTTPEETTPTEDETTPTEEETTPTEDETTPTEDEGSPAAAEQTVVDYYALLPDDTAEAWTRLGGSLKSQGRSTYEDFWAGIDSVELGSVDAEDETTVVYDITYVRTDGSTSDETKVITLEPTSSGYLITDDEPA